MKRFLSGISLSLGLALHELGAAAPVRTECILETEPPLRVVADTLRDCVERLRGSPATPDETGRVYAWYGERRLAIDGRRVYRYYEDSASWAPFANLSGKRNRAGLPPELILGPVTMAPWASSPDAQTRVDTPKLILDRSRSVGASPHAASPERSEPEPLFPGVSLPPLAFDRALKSQATPSSPTPSASREPWTESRLALVEAGFSPDTTASCRVRVEGVDYGQETADAEGCIDALIRLMDQLGSARLIQEARWRGKRLVISDRAVYTRVDDPVR